LTSIVIDPVAFLKGRGWTGSYEIWMEVLTRHKLHVGVKTTQTISQEAPSMEVLALSIS
jgi:hypothetical protein